MLVCFFSKRSFYWSIVDLQCCVSSRYIAKAIQLCVYLLRMCIFFFRFFFIIAYCEIHGSLCHAVGPCCCTPDSCREWLNSCLLSAKRMEILLANTCICSKWLLWFPLVDFKKLRKCQMYSLHSALSLFCLVTMAVLNMVLFVG